jgi:hypothetical protein
MDNPTLCLGCRWILPFVIHEGIGTFFCTNADAPFTEFVYGRKECQKINRGKCAYFQAREVPIPASGLPPAMNN